MRDVQADAAGSGVHGRDGLVGRLGAVGLFAVNAMEVVSYRQVLLADGFEAALGQHILWGYMLVVLAVHGPVTLALDSLRFGRRSSGAVRTAAT